MDAAFDERCRALLAGRSVTPPPPAETLFAPAGRRSVAPLAMGALLLAGVGIGGWWWSGAEKAPVPAVDPGTETPVDVESPAEAAPVLEVVQPVELAGEADAVDSPQAEAQPAPKTAPAEPVSPVSEAQRVEETATRERGPEADAVEPSAEGDVESVDVSAPQEEAALELPVSAAAEESGEQAEPAQKEQPVQESEQGPRELTLPITVPSDGGH